MERSIWATPVDIPGQSRRWQLLVGTHCDGRYWETTFLRPMTEESALASLKVMQARVIFQ